MGDSTRGAGKRNKGEKVNIYSRLSSHPVFVRVSFLLDSIQTSTAVLRIAMREPLHEKMDLLIFANEQICIKYDIY